MGWMRRCFAKAITAALLSLCCAACMGVFAGCIPTSGTKIPAWEVHVTEDSIEEHLSSYAWRDADDPAHVLRFFADGTYIEEGGEAAMLPEASQGATWEVLYCSADGYTNWQNVSQEQAEGVYAYRVVFRVAPGASGQIARLTVGWEGSALLLEGHLFAEESLAEGEGA